MEIVSGGSITFNYADGGSDIIRKNGKNVYSVYHTAQKGLDGGFTTKLVSKDKIFLNLISNQTDSVVLTREDGSKQIISRNDDGTYSTCSITKPGLDGAIKKIISVGDAVKKILDMPNQLQVTQLS